MVCNCKNNSDNVLSEAVRVVQGNAFTMRINMRYLTVVDGERATEPFPISQCQEVAVKLVKEGGEGQSAIYHFANNYSIDVDVSDDLPVGRYGLEITGVTKEGNAFRFYGRPDEVMEIVDSSEAVCFDMESCTSGYYDFNATLGMMQMPQAMLKEMEEATKASEEQLNKFKEIPMVTWEEAEEGGGNHE